MTEQVFQSEWSFWSTLQSFWPTTTTTKRSKSTPQKQVYAKSEKIYAEPKLVLVHAPNIEVYYWAPSPKNLQFGHLALRIFDHETNEDIYISQWPKGQKTSFQFDMDDEGRSPDAYLLIPVAMIYLDVLKKWWAQFVMDAKKGSENYNFLLNNCAQVVYRALRQGSFPHYFVLYPPKLTPWGVKDWIKSYSGVECKKDCSPMQLKKK